jgi:hypothetical protein
MKKKITDSKFYKLGISLTTGALIIIATILVILYAKGYRFEKMGLSETGQLVLKSEPDAASVFVNDKFVAATNSTLNLPPGEYTVRIVKDGYAPWIKKLKIEKEVVTPTDAILFSIAPELRRFTSTGALNPTLSVDKTKIAYGVASSSAYPPKNGVYVVNISERQNLFGSSTQFVVRDTVTVAYSSGKFLFSPDSRQLLVWFENQGVQEGQGEQVKTEIYGGVDLNNVISAFLLDTGKQTQEDVPDVSLNLAQILDGWQKERVQEKALQFNALKSDLRKIASSSMEIKDFTVDESKFIYLAKESRDIPVLIMPRLVGTNSTPEVRKIVQGKTYVYDIKEDRNYLIENPGEKLPMWLDTSRHFLTVESSKIYVTEYDGQNKTRVYSGSFDPSFVAAATNGNRVYFLTSFSPDLPLNLYALLVR